MKTFLLSLSGALLLTSIVFAQEPAAPAEAPAAITTATIENATVRAALEMPRNTPRDYFNAVTALMNLGEPAYAQQVFGELAKLKLTDAQRAELVREAGPAALQRLLNTPELAAAAAPFVEACLASAAKVNADPSRLTALFKQLGDEKEETRYAAFGALRSMGEPAVGACLAEIAETKDEAQQNRLREVLIGIGPLAAPALAAALDSPNEAVRRQAAFALGKLRELRVVGRLGAMSLTEPAGSTSQLAAAWAYHELTERGADLTSVLSELDAEIRATLNCVPPHEPTGEGLIVLPTNSDGALLALPPSEAAIVYAAHLSRLHSGLNPGDATALRRAMVLSLESQAILARRGTKWMLPETLQAELLTTTDASAALGEALTGAYHGAAEALANLLAERHDSAALVPLSGIESPLAAALRSPASKVRYAALRAVLEINPTSTFPGAARVAPALAHFAAGVTGQSGVVAYPNMSRAGDVAGLLNANGLAGRATNNGFDAVRAAREPGVELVLVDLATIEPPVRETIFRLRRQAESSNLPIAILASEGRLGEAQRIAAEHCNVLAFPRPHSAESVKGIVDQLRDVAPLGSSTAEERTAQAQQAVRWFDRMLTEGPEFYELRQRPDELLAAVEAAGDLNTALSLLTKLGTPASQQRLLDWASQTAGPLADRQAAAKAFDDSVKAHGLRLTTGQLLTQYDRYNASEAADPETQAVLGKVLDTIEMQRKK